MSLSRLVLVCSVLLRLGPSAFAATDGLVPVFVGVGERVTAFERPGQKIVPTRAQPQFYTAVHRNPAGAVIEPLAWVWRWVTQDLSGRGYLPADGDKPAAVWLVFTWGTVDPDISHLGLPIQRLNPHGRRIYEWQETNYIWGVSPSFCIVTAYDIAVLQQPARQQQPLWRAEMWTVLIRPRPSGQVEIGPVIFKDYVDGDAKK
jgi:hypothetical protein